MPHRRRACSIRCATGSGRNITPFAQKINIVFWIRRFILFHGKRHPREMGAPEVEAFLSDLAVNGQVAAATQN
jgi:hypothetical protein